MVHNEEATTTATRLAEAIIVRELLINGIKDASAAGALKTMTFFSLCPADNA